MNPLALRRDNRRCPPALELTVAISNGAGAALSAHLVACAACAARWRELARPGELARALPSSGPSAAELEQSRTRLLIAHADERSRAPVIGARRGGRAAALVAVSVAAAAALVVAGRAPRAPAPLSRPVAEIEFQTPHATVHARAGASFERQGSTADDVVRLRDGTARFDVRPLGTRQRFRVVAGNAEVEVRGTSFQVTVAGDRLAAVHVDHGRVEVRAEGRGVVILGPGDDWTAWPPSAGRSSAAAPTAAEAAFVEGWDAFRAGRLVGAIEAFDDVLRLDPTGSLAEDARYWKAVARARTGSRSAADELEGFVRDYPASPHANEARLLRSSLRAPGRPDTTSRRTSP